MGWFKDTALKSMKKDSIFLEHLGLRGDGDWCYLL